jgi:hypothetical protein
MALLRSVVFGRVERGANRKLAYCQVLLTLATAAGYHADFVTCVALEIQAFRAFSENTWLLCKSTGALRLARLAI